MSSSLRPGHLLSALGAVLLGAALWLPWYAVHLPAALGSGLEQGAAQAPVLGQLARELLAVLPHDLSVTAWQAFETADVLLALGAGLVVAAVAGATSGAVADGAVARLALVTGTGAALLVGVRLASPPGPSELLDVRYGAWLALAGALLVAAGGVMAAAPAGPASPAAPAAPLPPLPPFAPPRSPVGVPVPPSADAAPLPDGAAAARDTGASVAPPGR
ncbi:MAG TPA: hypothetical protein VLB47_03170 [Solirubrobacteraceae bacterium]|nr:hypothetical protein [Solirubrobacteraceae bacterium]